MNKSVQSASKCLFLDVYSIFVTCGLCFNIYSSSGLTMLKSSETMKKSLSSYWKWAYNLKAVLNDESDCSITVQLTSDSAEVCKFLVH